MIQLFLSLFMAAYWYYIWICHGKLSRKVFIIALIIVVASVAVVSSYDLYMRMRLSSGSEAEYRKVLYWTETVSDYYRKNALISALKTFLQHPVFGVGYNIFSQKNLAGFLFLGVSPHNQYLKILAEMGLFGFLPFMALLGLTIWSGMKLWKIAAASAIQQDVSIVVLVLLTGIASVMFGYLFTDSLATMSVTGYMWMFAGAVLVLDRLCAPSHERQELDSRP